MPVRESIYARCFDVGVFGAGYAGFAAAMSLAAAGRSVFLADLRGDLLWESGRAFFPETGPWTPAFAALGDCVTRISGLPGPDLDGATAELAANEWVRDARLPLLYQVAPVAVERGEGGVAAVVVATQSGLRRLAARQWIDATETGSLARLADAGLQPAPPIRRVARLLFQNRRWRDGGAASIEAPELPGVRMTWEPSCWPNERALRLELPGHDALFLESFAPALRAARARLAAELEGGFVSHASFEPFPVYARGRAGRISTANIALASPALAGQAIGTLVERYQLGLDAAATLASLPRCDEGGRRLRGPVRADGMETAAGMRAEVGVAGLGTGGVLAALAAAREGATVVAFDRLAFPGGVGTGAGIPEYYWGCEGGLQAEVDERVSILMPLFAGRGAWPRGFHPVAKRVVLHDLLQEAGVPMRFGAMLATVQRRGRRIESALLAGPEGLLRIKAAAWIDATGNGDLCAGARVPSRLGRDGDGNPDACTQSCGRFHLAEGRLVSVMVNPDTGFADPTDSEDMTRARVDGLHSLFEPVVNAFHRTLYVAPLLGVRQGRRLATRYHLTLDDLVERRRFPDAVGYTGCHYDNHALDYEFESDEAFFYVCCAGRWAARTACEIPYRMLLPKGLDNTWIACRAAGVTEEAVHSFRMQRDIQRIGEVCGLAAALAVRSRTRDARVSYERLRRRLQASGALTLRAPEHADFGRPVPPEDFRAPDAGLATEVRTARCLAALSGPDAGAALWTLHRSGRTKDLVSRLKPLLRSRDGAVSWRAAMLLGAWGDRAAEPRLLRALRVRESGGEYETHAQDPRKGWRGCLPRWWVAAWLLGHCGTTPALLALARLTVTDLPFHARTTVALACERLAGRLRPGPAVRRNLERFLDALGAFPASETHWQLDYAIARARRALRLPSDDITRPYAADPRAIVRRAFEKVSGTR